MKESLRKTISRKLKINKAIFLKRFGENINHRSKRKDGKIVGISFSIPDLKRNPMRFLGNATFTDPYTIVSRQIITIDSMGQPCINCKSNIEVEMHHIKHIKTINVKLNPFDQMVAKINRKQVPLCSKCHKEIHSGKYQGKALRYI